MRSSRLDFLNVIIDLRSHQIWLIKNSWLNSILSIYLSIKTCRPSKKGKSPMIRRLPNLMSLSPLLKTSHTNLEPPISNCSSTPCQPKSLNSPSPTSKISTIESSQLRDRPFHPEGKSRTSAGSMGGGAGWTSCWRRFLAGSRRWRLECSIYDRDKIKNRLSLRSVHLILIFDIILDITSTALWRIATNHGKSAVT